MSITEITIDGTRYEVKAIPNQPASRTPAPEPKDWELTAIKDRNGKVWPIEFWSANGTQQKGFLGNSYDYVLNCLERKGQSIHSVKRLSDEEVFSVGDVVDVYYQGGKQKLNEPMKITGFAVKSGLVVFHEGGDSSISEIQKLPPKPLPLFTTSDMVEIFPGTPYWHIVSDWAPQMEIAVEAGREEYKSRKMQTFSTESAAREYVLLNKPCLSVKEVFDISDTTVTGIDFERIIKELAKSKQSNNK